MNLFCSLALVLLMDVSGSVTPQHYNIQHQGLIAAFNDQNIQQSIVNQPGGVAITLIHWASQTDTVVGWMQIQSQQDLAQFIQRLQQVQRSDIGPFTAMGNALSTGMNMLETVPCQPERRIIDISADGSNNLGPNPEDIRELAEQQLITINGLPILSRFDPNLDQYFRENVITSDGFLIVANGPEDFSRAIQRKLALEIAAR